MTTTHPKCRRCDVQMVDGLALAQTLVPGAPDFIGDTEASTYSVGGPGELIDCWKCPSCGHSIALQVDS